MFRKAGEPEIRVEVETRPLDLMSGIIPGGWRAPSRAGLEYRERVGYTSLEKLAVRVDEKPALSFSTFRGFHFYDESRNPT